MCENLNMVASELHWLYNKSHKKELVGIRLRATVWLKLTVIKST